MPGFPLSLPIESSCGNERLKRFGTTEEHSSIQAIQDIVSIMNKLMTESSSIGPLKQNVVSISRNPEERLCSQLYCKVERTLKHKLDICLPYIKYDREVLIQKYKLSLHTYTDLNFIQ
jgi:hypothetical protein